MHSPVNKPGQVAPELALVSALAKHLLSPSASFEDPSLHARAATQDGLKCLATLDKPARLSLPVVAAAAEASQAPAVQPSEPEVNYGSQKPEYKAGLTDQAVVQALLSYHSRRRPLSSKEAPLTSFRPLSPGRLSQPALKPGTTRIFRSRGDF